MLQNYKRYANFDFPLSQGSAISRKKKRTESDTKHSIFAKPSSDKLTNRLSRPTKLSDYQRRRSASSLSPPPPPVYFSLIKISQSVSLLVGRVARVREADRGGVKGRSAYDGGTDGRADSVGSAMCNARLNMMRPLT